MGNRVNYGGPQNSLSAHLCARRLLKKEDLKSRPKEKEKRRANEDESYFRRRQLLFSALLVYKATLHASGEIKLVNFLLSSHQNPLPVWAKKKIPTRTAENKKQSEKIFTERNLMHQHDDGKKNVRLHLQQIFF